MYIGGVTLKMGVGPRGALRESVALVQGLNER